MKEVFFTICMVSFVPSVLFSIYMMLVPITEKYTNAKWQFSILKSIMILFVVPVYYIVSRLASGLGDSFNISLPNIFIKASNANGAQTVAQVVGKSDLQGLEEAAEKACTLQIDFFSMVGIFWVVGMVAIFAFQVYSYRKLLKRTKAIIPAVDMEYILSEQTQKLGITGSVSVFYDNYIDTPMLIGIVKPKILLTCCEVEKKYLENVLTHELTHLKRKDLWWKLALQAICTIHWFNPLVYLFRKEFEKQLEYSCDETVAEKLSFEERKKYGFAILQSVQVTNKAKYSFMGVGFATTKQKLERRITNMLKFKNMNKFNKILSATVAVAILTIVAVPAFANGVSSAEATPIFSNGIDGENNIVTYNDSRGTIDEENNADLIAMYCEFGISFDENENMSFNDELVRYFWDGVEIDKNTGTTRYEYFNEDGTVDVFTNRKVIDNGDGSINPFGDLIGLEKSSQKDFNNRDINKLQNPVNPVVIYEGNYNGSKDCVTFAELMKRFEPYGITYEVGGYYIGNIYYNGILVNRFSDTKPDGSVTQLESKDGGEINVVAVYDESGKLTGVKED